MPLLDALVRTAKHLCESEEMAEDMVQETYLQAWKYWYTFQTGTNCRAWLFRILFNVIKKTYGKQKETAMPLEQVPVESVLRFDANRQLETGEVLEAFNRLTAEHRAVLVLVAVEEMSYREAASVLEVPIGTVMSRLNRARTELRSLLGHERDRSLRGSGPIQQRF